MSPGKRADLLKFVGGSLIFILVFKCRFVSSVKFGSGFQSVLRSSLVLKLVGTSRFLDGPSALVSKTHGDWSVLALFHFWSWHKLSARPDGLVG